MSDSKDTGGAIFSFLTAIYIIISQIMTVVYFIQYCKTDDSILEIIFIDSVLSELKGLFWIFFVW